MHPVIKDETRELPVPYVWRDTIVLILSAIIDGDIEFEKIKDKVKPISRVDFNRIEENILSYGLEISKLPEETWQTSIYQYQFDGWKVLVDLFTEDSLSDLVLFLNVKETVDSYEFEIDDVHVP
jgi:hypothetical protein